MNTNSIRLATFVFLLLMTSMSFAQKDFQGKAYYQTKTTLDMSRFEGRQISEDQKKRISERMKSMFEKTYILTFNQIESIYKEEEKLEAPGARTGRWRGMMSSFTAGDQYKNVKEQTLLQDQEFFGKQFLIKDSLPQLKWVMGSETKQIGKYTCFKATAAKKNTDFDFNSFRRPPNREGNTEKDSTQTKNLSTKEENPNLVEVVVWYTPQIPINQGPGEYWGLPGLILEVNEGRTTILCSKIIMNPEEKGVIKAPSKGKEVSKEAYHAIVKKKTEEMRENFSRGGGRPGGRRR
ncbi:GLPGLI family protein [Flavivirga spongiicola]|uniref:GLPGLI family protein n=1 Tax=Flavivirga spongiicola TaxID=421621 RepID=A0ABU7XRE1_9FLAO|nr:GLPGLI family protein [Flavivirga sp. MEBiC05379]MDO5978349.1 GLPGLI family protein [Flavivirga sp. MEBiC05379]